MQVGWILITSRNPQYLNSQSVIDKRENSVIPAIIKFIDKMAIVR
jgi:hypothetical protein